MTLPVESPVLQMRDLRRDGRIHMEREVWNEAKAKIPEEHDLVCATMTSEERIGRVRLTISVPVIVELFRELKPRCSRVRLFAVLLIRVRRAARWGYFVGDDGEDCVSHCRAIGILFRSVLQMVRS